MQIDGILASKKPAEGAMAAFWVESIGLVADSLASLLDSQIRRVWVDEKEEGISSQPYCRNSFTFAMARLWNHCQFHCHDRIEHTDARIHHCDNVGSSNRASDLKMNSTNRLRRINDDSTNLVWVTIGSTSVQDVDPTIGWNGCWNTDRCSTIGDAV